MDLLHYLILFQYRIGGNRLRAGNFNGSSSRNNFGAYGYYWSSTRNDSTNAYNLNFNSGNVNPENNNNRYCGFPVRPVQNLSTNSFKFYTMFKLTKNQLILDLYTAFYCAKKHKSKKSYVKKFEENLDAEIMNLADELFSKSYKPKPSSCFIIERPKKREVFAAQFRDRIVHHLYYNYTHILFENTFIQDSYSCIPGRGTHYGIDRLKKHILKESRNYTRRCYVIKFDIKGYFMHINREKLLKIAQDSIIKMSKHRIEKKSKQLWENVIDISFILWLTKEIILLDPIKDCKIIGSEQDWKGLDYNKSLFNSKPGQGLPIGNLTSQLFSNVYLNVFDQFMKRELHCKHYGRYVDDSYVVSCDKTWILSLIPKVKLFLKTYLDLNLNMGKLIITKTKYGVEFLGAYIKPHRTYISNNSLRRMVKNFYDLSLNDIIETCKSINSFLGTLKHYSSYNIRKTLFYTPEILKISTLNKDILIVTPLIK